MDKRRDDFTSGTRPATSSTYRSIRMRPTRIIAGATIALLLVFLWQTIRSHRVVVVRGGLHEFDDTKTDPNKDQPPEPLHRVVGNNYAHDNPKSDRLNATILSLVRNDELEGLVASMQDLERTWNHRFNYPWTFFNDEPFTGEFKRITQAATKAKCFYELIPRVHWDIPSWINKCVMEENAKLLEEKNVQYARLESYHQMCRWYSGFFYKHPALRDTQYYWRVEPKVNFFCDVEYDVFRYMQDHNKTYGFTINIYDSPESIETLWPETMKFVASNKNYVHRKNAEDWLTDKERRPRHHQIAQGYSTCHFWSNFEIADMSFWRSPVYEAYFEHLDRAGGFFYERWGDAPVHSIALGLFEDRSKIHWFKDIGYRHFPYTNCPNSPKCKNCQAGKFNDGEPLLQREDCRPNWFRYVGNEWSPGSAF